MPAAYTGKILHVDLSDGRTWVEEPGERLYRRYLGGSAMASHFMLRDIPVGADPLWIAPPRLQAADQNVWKSYSEYILARMLKEVCLLPPGEGQDEGI